MLDGDEQVKRNMERFPETFAFKLTEEETGLMVSQNAMLSMQVLGGSLPRFYGAWCINARQCVKEQKGH